MEGPKKEETNIGLMRCDSGQCASGPEGGGRTGCVLPYLVSNTLLRALLSGKPVSKRGSLPAYVLLLEGVMEHTRTVTKI